MANTFPVRSRGWRYRDVSTTLGRAGSPYTTTIQALVWVDESPKPCGPDAVKTMLSTATKMMTIGTAAPRAGRLRLNSEVFVIEIDVMQFCGQYDRRTASRFHATEVAANVAPAKLPLRHAWPGPYR